MNISHVNHIFLILNQNFKIIISIYKSNIFVKYYTILVLKPFILFQAI